MRGNKHLFEIKESRYVDTLTDPARTQIVIRLGDKGEVC